MKSTEPQKAEGSSDLDRLREIFFQLTECRDDSQQRGWAVHDDQQIIMDYLDELLQILVWLCVCVREREYAWVCVCGEYMCVCMCVYHSYILDVHVY